MGTQTMIFNADQVRDFNTRNDLGPVGETTIRANGKSPSRLLDGDASETNPTHSDVLQGATITNYRATFETDIDNEVVPGSTVGIEYSTDNGVTWSNFYDDSNLAEDGYGQYQVHLDGGTNADGTNATDEWISIIAYPDPNATNPSTDTDGTGFMLSDNPITTGDLFSTPDGPLNANSEFSLVCFTTGMRIETENGPVAVENLQLGDMVMTLDHGMQPVRFIYRSKQRALGAMRPIVFEKGALGDNERFVVSQRHRIHTSELIELNPVFDSVNDSLIEAIQLVNGTTIRVTDEFEYVEYFHIMFDNHELIWSEGVLSESWQPHKRNLSRDKALREELLAIFPEIATKNKMVNPKPARQTVEFVR